MHRFTDGAEKSWDVVINVGQIRKVRDTLSLDIYKLIDDRAQPLSDLLSDPCRLVDVLYVLCREQAEKAGVSDEDFGRSFSGDSLEAAGEAFLAELVDFFPGRPRASLKKLLEKSKALKGLLMDRAEKEIDGVDLDQIADSLAAKWKNSSGTAPASSVSTPTVAL